MSRNEAIDGVERDVRRAGDEPPDIPSESELEDLLPRLLEGVDEVATGYFVRASLPTEDPERAGGRLVDALERKVTVLGSTLEAGIDPAEPQVDALIQCEYTASQVASALGGVTPVRGAVVVEATDVCERLLGTPDEEADVADANDVFNELQQQVSELDYDQVVDELEGVSFPGGPDADEEVDLEDEADVDLGSSNDDGDVALEDVALDDEALAGDSGTDDAGSSADGTDPSADGTDSGTDEVDAKELFGEGNAATDGRGSTSATQGGADERSIEEAVKSVEEKTGEQAAEEQATEEDGPDDGADVQGDGADVQADGEANDPAENTADGGPSEDSPSLDGVEQTGTEQIDTDDGTSSNGAGGSIPNASPTPQAATGDLDELVDDLVTALESGAVGPDRRQRLREALGVESTHSLDVRLEYLQKRVDNLAAYTDAWEAFLAEEGTGNKFIEEMDEEMESLRTRVDALESGGGSASGTDDDLEDRVDDHEQRLDDVEDTVGSLRRSVEALGNWRDKVNDLLGD